MTFNRRQYHVIYVLFTSIEGILCHSAIWDVYKQKRAVSMQSNMHDMSR